MAKSPNYHPVNKDGLFGWWSYRNTGSVSALGTWSDYSGNSNDGTLNGNAYVNNNGANFDGSGDYNELPEIITASYPKTISTWFNPANVTTDQMVWNLGRTGGSDYIGLRIRGADSNIVLRSNNTSIANDNETSVILSINNWHNVVIIFHSQSNASCYVNGDIKFSAQSLVSTAGLDRFSMGVLGRSTNVWYYNGKIDDFQVYNRALSAGEIKLNYLKNKRN